MAAATALFPLLQGPHAGVGTAGGKQGGVAALFDDAAVLHDQDFVGIHTVDRRWAMTRVVRP